MLPQLDERALRRPDFVGGEPVPLFDGQTWYFPKLDGRLDLRPTEDGMVAYIDWLIACERDPQFSEQFSLQCLPAILYAAGIGPDTFEDKNDATIAPLGFLLRRNYLLTPEQDRKSVV